ncbi:UNVERIFIED_CONTAM: hypothetical protein FKN15_017771 [Acipenser sinensis]
MNTRCLPKLVPSAAHFFTLCRLTVQPPQSYSVGGQRSSGQLTGKPAGARPDVAGARLTVQPPQSYSVGGQRSSGQLTGKPAGARPDVAGARVLGRHIEIPGHLPQNRDDPEENGDMWQPESSHNQTT